MLRVKFSAVEFPYLVTLKVYILYIDADVWPLKPTIQA